MRALILLLAACASPPAPPPDPIDDDGDGWTATDGDCDDQDATIGPAAPERCNGHDDDCDGAIDADDPTLRDFAYTDADGDGGFGTWARSCSGVAVPDDCADDDPDLGPHADDPPCDGIDTNCDGVAVEAGAIGARAYADLTDAFDGLTDGDTLVICPGTWSGPFTIGDGLTATVTSWSGDPSDTVLTTDGADVVTVGRDVDLSLRSLSFTGARWVGGESLGFGIVAGGARAVALSDVVFSDVAGAAYLEQVRFVEITDAVVEGGATGEGWGGFAVFTDNDPEATVQIADTEIAGLQAGWPFAMFGAGAFALDRVSVHDNVSEALFRIGPVAGEQQLVVTDSRFERNAAIYPGDELITMTSGGDLRFVDTVFADNPAVLADEYSGGSGWGFERGSVVGNGVEGLPLFALLLESRVDAVGVDWGEGERDNRGATELSFDGGLSYRFGAAATFVCSDGACSP